MEKKEDQGLNEVGTKAKDIFEELTFQKCYCCGGRGKVAAINGRDNAPLSSIPYLLPMGSMKINVVRCDECNGRGKMLTLWGMNLAETLKEVAEMADENKIRYEEAEKRMKDVADEENSNKSSSVQPT